MSLDMLELREVKSMGIIKSNVNLLLSGKKRGVDFTKVATLGHLKWYVSKKELKESTDFYKIDISKVEETLSTSKYSDAFFHEVLGVKSLTTIDNSNYEGANISHDLNTPIPKSLEGLFDVVLDSGTLEHVFNFPVAIENCMKMLKLGGTLFICTPANNYMGHGFYQFSPELFFRILDKENGFEIKNTILVKHPYAGAELSSNQKIYQVLDPNILKQRGILIGRKPILLMIEAKKISNLEIFAKSPQQSDYTKIWSDFEKKEKIGSSGGRKESLKKVLGSMPKFIQNFVWGQYWKKTYSINNKKFFKRLEHID